MRRNSDHWFPACWVCPTQSRSPRQSQSATASPRLPSLFLRRWCDPLVTRPLLYSAVQYCVCGVTPCTVQCSIVLYMWCDPLLCPVSPPRCCTPHHQYHYACCPPLSPSPPNMCYLQRLQPAPLLLPPGLLGLARLRPAALPRGRGQHQPAALRRLGARHTLLSAYQPVIK